ncbi:hypothetical protein UPYG_G00060040 [Umbra pygmaea]|uniref:Ig-like domain-containing protein n=1 Tax=Umbra pygmaea TaxID=75934 RepID=A0ABD0XCG8_UMBPY
MTSGSRLKQVDTSCVDTDIEGDLQNQSLLMLSEKAEMMTVKDFFRTMLVILGVCTCCHEANATVLSRPRLTGPYVALVGAVESFECGLQDSPENQTILYKLYRKEDQSKIISEYSSLNGDRALFTIVVSTSYEGNLVCVASVQNNTAIQPTYSNVNYFRVLVPVEGAKLVASSGSLELHEGKTLALRCNISKGNHVTYDWQMDGKPLPTSPPYYPRREELFIYRTTPQHSGAYRCVATNQLNETQIYSSKSDALDIKVKGQLQELVSEPELSFYVFKENTFFASVTCQSLNGTPPITFSLYNRTELVGNGTVHGQNFVFNISVVLDRHMGWLQCQAENGDKVAYSKWVAMHIVTVGGTVTMTYDTDVGENFSIVGLRFYCSVERGTFPQYRWFLNGTFLEGRSNFYWVESQPERSILFLAVGSDSSGTYHCEVSDSFDDMNVVRSMEKYIDEKVLNELPTAVLAVVFGCFLFLIVLLTICCLVGLFYSKSKYHVEESILDLRSGLEKRNRMVADRHGDILLGHPCIMVADFDNQVHEDEDDYMEGEDLVRGDDIIDPDQWDAESTDEWLELQQKCQKRKTFEDEDVFLDDP